MRTRVVLLLIGLACGLTLCSCGGGKANKANSWIELKPSGVLPSARFGEALICLPDTGNVIMFGGASDAEHPLNDTWMYDRQKNHWTELKPIGDLPVPRWSTAAAYDPDARRIVMFGGIAATGVLGDTWAYDVAGNQWTELSPDSAPSARHGTMMVFDSSARTMVMFGGAYLRTTPTSSFQQDFYDTWAFTLATGRWRNLGPSGSPDSFGPNTEAMVRDEAAGRTLLFVGADPHPSVLVPPERLRKDWFTFAYDPSHNAWGAGPRPAVSPPVSGDYVLALDSTLHRIVLFGGADASGGARNQTWVFDLGANTWSMAVAGGQDSPPPRVDHAMVYNPKTGTVIMFGGLNANRTGALGDTWEYRP